MAIGIASVFHYAKESICFNSMFRCGKRGRGFLNYWMMKIDDFINASGSQKSHINLACYWYVYWIIFI